VNIDSSHKMK